MIKLPRGVIYQPNRPRLCGFDDDCLIRLPAGYDIAEVGMESTPYLRGGWCKRAVSDPVRKAPAYALAWSDEFRITIVSEIACTSSDKTIADRTLLGGRVDVYPSMTAHLIDRIYEFQTYGMAVLDSNTGTLDVRVARPGDKVLAPARTYCGLYGLGETLVALEHYSGESGTLGDPEWKNSIEGAGPHIPGYYNRNEVVFVLNSPHMKFGPRGPGTSMGERSDVAERSIRVLRSTRLTLAPFLYRKLTTDLDLAGRFHSLGLRISKADPEVELPPDPSRPKRFPRRIYFSGPLSEEPGTESLLREYLGLPSLHGSPSEVEAPWRSRFISKFEARLNSARRLVQLTPHNDGAFSVVIEGTGEWTNKCYRPAILDLSAGGGREINAYYANDENWKAAPSWRSSLRVRGREGEQWLTEEYWNKADPADFGIYDNMSSVDAVFVVTPDVTHVETARRWLGRTPVIFVEKPFATDEERFRELLYSMATQEARGGYKTAVVGIDHYLLRLTPLFGQMASLLTEFPDGLVDISFEMTEANPIEEGRERTLSLGLGMDMLPHFVAVLVLLGELSSIDMISVLRAVQYRPLDLQKFDNETGLVGACRIRDYAGITMPAAFCAGKGVVPAFKRIQLRATNGGTVAIDYSTKEVRAGGRLLGKILGSEEAYKTLISDLYQGRDSVVSACLNVAEAEQIVRFVDVMWRATQAIKETGFEIVPQGTEVCQNGAGAAVGI